MKPFTVHRSASETWTSTPVHFNGREFRRVRFANGVRVTFAVWEHKSPSVFTGAVITRRAA
jgi:hypothetical protein